MALIGIVTSLRKFMSYSDEDICVESRGSSYIVLKLEADRKYIVPEYQREIRWDTDNLFQLIEDIRNGPKYLGNLILTEHDNGAAFHIVDGQQRITTITMLLTCIRHLHSPALSVLVPCRLEVESFSKFNYLLDNYFEEDKRIEEQVDMSDKLRQLHSFCSLWDEMNSNPIITNRLSAGTFLDNLLDSEFNLIINRAGDDRKSIRYFIDVNLKGKRLDTEDIFKAYLFRNDPHPEVRSEWYKLKKNAKKLESMSVNYPLLKLIEHFLYCDLYTETAFTGLSFGEDFTLTKEFSTHGEHPSFFRKGTHIVEVINDNAYMITVLKKVNTAIEFFLLIVNNSAPSASFKEFFPCDDRIQEIEFAIMHNFMKKILKDSKILPKALLLKYYLTIVIYNEQNKSKSEYRKIYGSYLLYVLFIIFENKKSVDVLVNILKAGAPTWYSKLVEQIQTFFSPEKITDNKLLAQYKLSANEEGEDFRFRCKSLATIYNFFNVRNGIVTITSLDNLNRFVTDDTTFSMEHFIISNSDNISINEFAYKIPNDIANKYKLNIFNFIFLNNSLNEDLGNCWLPRKLEIIAEQRASIHCEYSLMLIEKMLNLSNAFKHHINDAPNQTVALNSFFSDQFKTYYRQYARDVLDEVVCRFRR